MRRSGPPKAKREKKCKACHKLFRPFTSTQTVCGVSCSLEVVRQQRAKVARKKHRADKERVKPRSKVIAEAQAAFNAFIRLRDDHQPCISCDVTHPPERPGGAWDCGHYLTRGAHPELRFEELNGHRQCKSCNGGSGRFSHKGRTVQEEYRARLIVRIGLDSVKWLEGPHEPKRYCVDELREIKANYQMKVRELKKSRARP